MDKVQEAIKETIKSRIHAITDDIKQLNVKLSQAHAVLSELQMLAEDFNKRVAPGDRIFSQGIPYLHIVRSD